MSNEAGASEIALSSAAWRDINGLVPYARNARTHSEAQIAQIAGSIREFGFTNPVLIDPEGGIIAGHGPNAPAWPAAAPASAAEPAAPPSPVTALPPAAKLSRRLAAARRSGLIAALPAEDAAASAMPDIPPPR